MTKETSDLKELHDNEHNKWVNIVKDVKGY